MIDWARVLQMHEEVGAQEFGPLIALFLAETEARLMHLGASPAQFLLDLHFLRGSALTLGFADFADLCLRTEAQLVEGNINQHSRADLAASFAAAKRQFLHELDGVLARADPPCPGGG